MELTIKSLKNKVKEAFASAFWPAPATKKPTSAEIIKKYKIIDFRSSQEF